MKMKIDVISDLHVDFYLNKISISDYIKTILPDKPSKLLVIAGDISNTVSNSVLFLSQIRKYYEKVVVVFGNHDLYTHSPLDYQAGVETNNILYSWGKLEEIMKNDEGVVFLNGGTFEYQGYVFGGSGGWYDLSYANDKLNISEEDILNYYKDKSKDAKLIPLMLEFNKDFFEKEFRKIEAVSKTSDVIITHFPPSQDFIAEKYEKNRVNSFFCFKGDEIIKKTKAQLWVFGHTHHHFDETKNDTRLINNCVGYPHETYFPLKAKTIQLRK